MQQFSVSQWPGIRSADTIEDCLIPLLIIDWQVGSAFELADRARSLCALVDEANNLHIQFIDLLSPVRDLHAVSSLTQQRALKQRSLRYVLYSP
jgi:hypothetical protein